MESARPVAVGEWLMENEMKNSIRRLAGDIPKPR